MKVNKPFVSTLFIAGLTMIAVFFVAQNIFAMQQSIPSQVIVGAATPTPTAVTVNGGNVITLNTNATTSVSVSATITDVNGCGEITPGTTTVLLYRGGTGTGVITSSSCMSAQNPLYCYLANAFTTSSVCSAGSENTTTTFVLQYFAQATDVGSSYPSGTWQATVVFKTPDNTTGSADTVGVDLNTLTAINVTTSSINYGAIAASSTTGSTDSLTPVTNVGNSSTSLQVDAAPTLTNTASSSETIATSSQGYYISPFTYAGSSTPLSGTAATVTGFLLTSPTSTTNVSGTIYWGLGVPGNTPTGTYSGTNVFTALFHA